MFRFWMVLSLCLVTSLTMVARPAHAEETKERLGRDLRLRQMFSMEWQTEEWSKVAGDEGAVEKTRSRVFRIALKTPLYIGEKLIVALDGAYSGKRMETDWAHQVELEDAAPLRAGKVGLHGIFRFAEDLQWLLGGSVSVAGDFQDDFDHEAMSWMAQSGVRWAMSERWSAIFGLIYSPSSQLVSWLPLIALRYQDEGFGFQLTVPEGVRTHLFVGDDFLLRARLGLGGGRWLLDRWSESVMMRQVDVVASMEASYEVLDGVELNLELGRVLYRLQDIEVDAFGYSAGVEPSPVFFGGLGLSFTPRLARHFVD